MQKLAAVEEAKALLNEAKDWSILKWLTEKRRVRTIADKGTAALDSLDRQVKSSWTADLRSAYAALAAPASNSDGDDPFAASEHEFVKQQAEKLPAALKATAQRIRQVDDIADQARLTAERTFDEAERRMSASVARRGVEEAIEAYDLRYKAIAEAQAAKEH
jgi:hypothetical protein